MGILWLESFDFYGTNNDNENEDLTLRGYNYNVAHVQTDIVRTGTAALRCFSTSSPTALQIGLGTLTDFALGAGIYWPANPSGNAGWRKQGLHFGPSSETFQFNVVCGNDLNIELRDVGDNLLGSSANNIVTIGAWHWLEVNAQHNKGANTINFQIYFNGNLILVVSGHSYSGANDINNCAVGKSNTSGFSPTGAAIEAYYDDWLIADEYIGDRRLVTKLAYADGALQNWAPSTGSDGSAMINQADPDDATYIQGTAPGQISDFDMTADPFTTDNVLGVAVIGRVFKDTAGSGDVSLGIKSGAATSMGGNESPGTSPTYIQHISDINPATGEAWTRETADAAQLRIERV